MAVAPDSFSLFLNDLLPILRKLEEILALFGLLYISKVGINTLCDLTVGVRAHFYSKLWKRNFVQRFGKWAVVTGCTDGIGKCYAEELAKEGVNLILISRTMDKLNRVASELESKYNIETEIIQIDFSEGKPVYDKISEHLTNIEIGMLINNVGVMFPYPKYFTTVTDMEIWSHVNVNIASVCAMTKMILPQMVNRGKGAVINIASIGGSGPMPMMSLYSSSKAFVDNFSQALEWEYRNKGVTVQTVIPSYVPTNMNTFLPRLGTASFLTPSASVFASHAISTIGYTKRTTGHWIHGIEAWFVHKMMSTWSFMFIMQLIQKFLVKDSKKTHKL